MNEPPTLSFVEVTVGGDNLWELQSINEPYWELKNGSVGQIYAPGCHTFILVDSRNGEVLTRFCSLPEPLTS